MARRPATADKAPDKAPAEAPDEAPTEATLTGDTLDLTALERDRAAAPRAGRAPDRTGTPAYGRLGVVRRAWRAGRADNASLLAAGVAFFGFLAIPPALVALLSVYGLVRKPGQVASQVAGLTKGLPAASRTLLQEQVSNVTAQESRTLGVSLVVGLALALFSASAAVMNLMRALDVAYDVTESRGFVKMRATAIALTGGAVVFMVVMLGLVAAVPPVLRHLHLGSAATMGAEVARWALLVLLLVAGLAVVYRFGPYRPGARLRWFDPGALLATVVWVVASVGFSLYVSRSGTYGAKYGALAGVVVLLLWTYLSSYAVLLGAEVNRAAAARWERPAG